MDWKRSLLTFQLHSTLWPLQTHLVSGTMAITVRCEFEALAVAMPTQLDAFATTDPF